MYRKVRLGKGRERKENMGERNLRGASYPKAKQLTEIKQPGEGRGSRYWNKEI